MQLFESVSVAKTALCVAPMISNTFADSVCMQKCSQPIAKQVFAPTLISEYASLFSEK